MRTRKFHQSGQQNAKNGSKINTVAYLITILSFIFSLIYVSVRASLDTQYRAQSEYKLIIFQSLFGILCVNLPTLLTRKLRLTIPNLFASLYAIFLWCAIFLGEFLLFYDKLAHFDDLLHLVSSMMLGLLGFSVIDILGDARSRILRISPGLEAFFAVCFAVFIGTLWEIYEFTFDGLLGLNMQKFRTPTADGFTDLVGRMALTDTMTDLIIDLLGALSVAVFGYATLKTRRPWLSHFKVTPKAPQNHSPSTIPYHTTAHQHKSAIQQQSHSAPKQQNHSTPTEQNHPQPKQQNHSATRHQQS